MTPEDPRQWTAYTATGEEELDLPLPLWHAAVHQNKGYSSGPASKYAPHAASTHVPHVIQPSTDVTRSPAHTGSAARPTAPFTSVTVG